MRRKIIAGLASGMLLVGMLGTSASAQETGPLWESDDVVVRDSQHVLVGDPEQRPEQEAEITLEGPDELLTGETGQYTVTVRNTSKERDLASWKLGLGVDGITSVDDITIHYSGDETTDLTADGGTDAIDVSFDEDDDVLYLRGSNDPRIEVDGPDYVLTFDVTFNVHGYFIGTAVVIDEEKSLHVPPDVPQYYPYYDVEGGTKRDRDPMKPRGLDHLPEDYQCSLHRNGWRDKPLDEGGKTLRWDNFVQCFDHSNGELFYWHYLLLVEEGDPLWDTAGHRGVAESDLGNPGAGRTYRALSVNTFDGTSIHSVDVTSREEIEKWVGFPAIEDPVDGDGPGDGGDEGGGGEGENGSDD